MKANSGIGPGAARVTGSADRRIDASVSAAAFHVLSIGGETKVAACPDSNSQILLRPPAVSAENDDTRFFLTAVTARKQEK